MGDYLAVSPSVKFRRLQLITCRLNLVLLVPYSYFSSRVLNFAKLTDPYFARLYFRDFRERSQRLKIMRKYRLYFRDFFQIVKIKTRENKYE